MPSLHQNKQWINRFFVMLVYSAICCFLIESITAMSLPKVPSASDGSRVVIIGGTGKIGTAVAAHLSHRISSVATSQEQQQSLLPNPSNCEIVLVGRNKNENNEYFETILQEIDTLLELSKSDKSSADPNALRPKISYECVEDIWKAGAMDDILLGKTASSDPNVAPVACVIHTAGPYADREDPVVLDACIDCKIPVYVDVSDPIDFLEDSLKRHESAVASGTTAILAAGAFPGMSNVLAMEAAAKARQTADGDNSVTTAIKDVRFNYFTKGLGGSGTINLYITNIGFGDPMVMHDKGKRTRFEDLSGRLLGKVDFFVDPEAAATATNNSSWKEANDRAKERVGTQKVFAWPFPEAATVASELGVSGSSSSAMGTAPDLWNDMLGLLVDLVPRNWWKSRAFSKFLADFSEPLVLATDLAMRKLSSSSSTEGGDCGETHAMRVDVVAETANTETDSVTESMVSMVQCHDSFRRCVGQSCAEFALDAWWEHLAANDGKSTPKTGVYLPEQRYREAEDRRRIIDKLTSTPGTFCYTGPVAVASRSIPAANSKDAEDASPFPDRILLKKTPTPGLICNGAPIEIILEQDDDDQDDIKSNKKAELPVYPTQVREVVQSMENKVP